MILLSWTAAVRKKGVMTLRIDLALLFQPWQYTLAPKGSRGAVCEPFTGRPVYRFKIYRGKSYLLRPMPAAQFDWFIDQMEAYYGFS